MQKNFINLQTKLKACSLIINKKQYNAIKLDFEKKLIIATNGFILLKMHYDFDVNFNRVESDMFKTKKSIIFNNIYVDELIKYLDLSSNLFDVLERHLGIYEYQSIFPDVDKIIFNQTEDIQTIKYNAKHLLSIFKVCKQLQIENTVFNFNGSKSPTQIIADDVEIILMPICI